MKHIQFIAVACALVSAAGDTHAAPMIFDDRAAFEAATNPNAWVDFNDIEVGSSFEEQTLSAGPLSLTGGVDPNFPGNRNRIRNGQLYDIDGTNHVYGTAFTGNPVRIDFLAPVLAWGADFKDIGDEGRRTLLRFFDEDSIEIGEVDLFDRDDLAIQFVGIDLDGAKAARMEILHYFGPIYEDFGMDNVVMTLDRAAPAPAPVPLPAGAFLLGSALGGFGLKRALSKARRPGAVS